VDLAALCAAIHDGTIAQIPVAQTYWILDLLVWARWSMEGWHWIRDTQLHEDAHRYRGISAGALATLRTAAL
jgi:hypothetical protein